MVIITLMIAGIAVFRNFVKMQIFGIEMIYICIFLLIGYYIYQICGRSNFKLRIREYEMPWLSLVLYAVFIAVLSLSGLTKLYIRDKLLIDLRYLARQVYYVALFPAVILVANSRSEKKVYEFMKKHNRKLIAAMLILNLIQNKGLSLWITEIYIISFLCLLNPKRDTLDWLIFALILFSPIIEGGEMTNILIRLIFIVVFISGKEHTFPLKSMVIGIWCCVCICFIIPFLLEAFGSTLDANTLWRARFWGDELKTLSSILFIGVGFGTAYCSSNFVDINQYIPPSSPFAATEQYTVYDKVFVTGPHNSFVSLTFRLGIIGILLFAAFLITIQRKQLKNINSVSLGSFFAVCSSLTIIALNVGLESPAYLLLFLFAVCSANYEIKMMN